MLANPTNDRLNFILKTYGKKYPQVVMDMVSIITRTVGEDEWMHELIEASQETDRRFHDDFGRWRASGSRRVADVVDDPVQFVTATVGMVNELPKFKTRHRADPIFPWIATQLAGLQKQLEAPPGTYHDDVASHRAAKEAYMRTMGKLVRGGTMLAQWYEAKRPNLGQYDLDEAWDEATKWQQTEGPIPQGEVVAELSDGWTAQDLTTKEQLNAEGDKMQHCVGSYANQVAAGDTTIYSLRDAKGQPHVTIEVKDDRVQQTRGKQNERPAEKYQKYIDEFDKWLEENDVDTARMPKHLEPYAAALEAHGHDVDEDHLEMFANDWYENVSDSESTVAWLKAGISYNDAELAGSLESENVTPEEFVKFPGPVLYKISEDGGVPRDLDALVNIARMANVLAELAPERDPVSASTQMSLFDAPVPEPGSRVPGHDPTGKQTMKSRWSGALLTDREVRAWPSKKFGYWSEDSYGQDYEWLYPAEEWIDEDFSSRPKDDKYVGPWFIHRFTPKEASEWWDAGIEDGEKAADLLAHRVTLKLLKQLDDDEDIPWINVEKASVAEIVDAVDAAGIRRNPSPRRSSRRRTSR